MHARPWVRMYIRTCSLLKIEHLFTIIKLFLYKVLIRSVTVNACHTWQYTADADLLKL
jgi:hypothetical protein